MHISSDASDKEDREQAGTSPVAAEDKKEDNQKIKARKQPVILPREDTERPGEARQVHLDSIELQNKNSQQIENEEIESSKSKPKSNKIKKAVKKAKIVDKIINAKASNGQDQEKEEGAPKTPPATFLGHQNPMMQQLEGKVLGLAKEQLKAARGEEIHQNYLKRRSTTKWLDETDEGLVSFEKMQLVVNQTHPRVRINGKQEKIPLCVSTGRLGQFQSSRSQIDGIDELGLGASLYFKLLKSLIFYFFIASVVNIPVYYIYGKGQQKFNSTASWLSFLTLGNIGQTSLHCAQNNLNVYDYQLIQCPGGSKITELLELGVQKINEPNTNVCPLVLKDGVAGIDLDLDPECSWKWKPRAESAPTQAQKTDKTKSQQKYGEAFYDSFVENCLGGYEDAAAKTIPLVGKRSCNMTMIDDPNTFWSSACYLKIKGTTTTTNSTAQKQKELEKLRDKAERKGWTINEEQPIQVYAKVLCQGVAIGLGPVGGGVAKQSELTKSRSLERGQLGILVVVIDLICIFAFLIYLWFLEYFVKVDAQKHQNLLFETSEFALEFQNLPALNETFKLGLLKAQLWDHIETQIKDRPQQIKKLAETPNDQACEIIDIQFAMSDYKYLEHAKRIQEISQEVQKCDILLQRNIKLQENDSNQTLKDTKKRHLSEINEIREEYYTSLQVMGKNNQAIAAIVTFRSMEGVQRALDAFRINRTTKTLSDINCLCCRRQDFQKLKFNGKWLKVKEAVEPELIIWQNYGITRTERCRRGFVFALCMLILLIISFQSVFRFEDLIYSWETRLPPVACGSKNYKDVDVKAALADYKLSYEYRNGNWQCFCSNQQKQLSAKLFQELVFEDPNPSGDGQYTCSGPDGTDCHYCTYWQSLSTKTAWLVLLIPLIMGIVDEIVIVCFELAAEYKKPINETQNLVNQIAGIMWIQFLNLGFILIFVSIKMDIPILQTLGLFTGQYREFNQPWYGKFGETIVLMMITQAAVPHLSGLIQLAYFGVWRCCDRGCSRDARKTKQIFQRDYEAVNIGPHFLLDTRLAQILATTFVTFMFAPAMPVLYLIMILNLSLTYWIDKVLLLRFYRSPKNFDDSTIHFTITMMKFSFIFHFICAYFTLGNKDILSSENYSFDKKTERKLAKAYNNSIILKFFDPDVFTQKHIILLLCGAVLVLVLQIFENTVFVLLNKCCNRKMQQEFEKMEAISDDYYNEIYLKFLLAELARAKIDKKQATIESEEASSDAQAIYKKFIKRMEAKRSTIESKIDDLCKQVDIQEADMREKTKQLRLKEAELIDKKAYLMKSKLQTYDIRDSEDYNGILELEKLLLKTSKGQPADQFEEGLRTTMMNSVRRRKARKTRKDAELEELAEIETIEDV